MDSKKRRERILSILAPQIKKNEILSMFEGGRGGTPTRSAPRKPAGRKGKKMDKSGPAKKKKKKKGGEMLKSLSTKQLRKEAKRAGVKGSASMSRKQLLRDAKKRGGVVLEGPGLVIRKRLKVGGGASEEEIIEKLDKLKMPQLNALAKKANIVGYSRKTKTPLVTMLARYAQ